MNSIDLHMHSIYSLDGEKTVDELLAIAHESHIHTIAIADHNSTLAYRDIKNTDVNVIPAIEVDCSFHDKDFHILGYFIDPFHPVWDTIRNNVSEMEKKAGLKRLEIIQNEMGIKIDMDKLKELRPNGIYEAESVCEVALSMPENDDNPYLLEFRPGKKHGVSPYVDFFWEYCAKGKIAYSPIEFMSMEEIIQIFRSQNAFISLAHPGNNVKEDDQLLEDIISLGIDGLEVYSSYHSFEQIEYYRNKALAHNLVMSAGSDYHGKTKPHIHMGDCQMPFNDEQNLITYLKERS
ncbi:MAG: PHP domain-containing protein [Erysipelotrichaceae bacterium]|uniref:PHP domain-containing protein n=3 Tax=Floccifex sp. TaxID=2815810 RepID=UPI002A75E54C|nr:PHP domain-containing protein [Floccifex sp.]MDD7280837.1 PHP domain-containing protein [Erysipelotrichaceae bacterium]MDY2958182.1 PHP domain-containing protein [Floccifex sp.]